MSYEPPDPASIPYNRKLPKQRRRRHPCRRRHTAARRFAEKGDLFQRSPSSVDWFFRIGTVLVLATDALL